MAGFTNTLLNKWRYGSLLNRIIFINVAVFLLLHLFTLVFGLMNLALGQTILSLVELPASPIRYIYQPWSIFTYMFAQYDLFHLLFNMLWLYWFGEIFLLTDTSRRLTALYIYGGVAGGVLFMVSYTLLPVSHHPGAGMLIGASAAVIAIVTATAILHPDYKVMLLLLGEVSVKWIAIITIAIDFLSVGGNNGGGHIAHIGGACMGVVFALAQKRGIDITKPFNRTLDKLANMLHTLLRRRHLQNPRRYGIADRNRLDMLLDKVRASGYGSLTRQEKEELINLSRKINI